MKNGHRPMRRQKREVTSPEELRRSLEKCQILRIGAKSRSVRRPRQLWF